MTIVGEILVQLIGLAIIVLIARFIVGWVQMFARRWQPRGFVAVLCEVIFSLTDPPLRAMRRVIPSIRLGGVILDLSAMVLLLLLFIARAIVIQVFFV